MDKEPPCTWFIPGLNDENGYCVVTDPPIGQIEYKVPGSGQVDYHGYLGMGIVI